MREGFYHANKFLDAAAPTLSLLQHSIYSVIKGHHLPHFFHVDSFAMCWVGMDTCVMFATSSHPAIDPLCYPWACCLLKPSQRCAGTPWLSSASTHLQL